MKRKLIDQFNRQYLYLRLSITERCNFKCIYCLPEGYREQSSSSPELSLKEIENLTSALVNLGIKKIRLTGGEPTLRKDLLKIIALIKRKGIKDIGITTNGFKLKNIAKDLKEAGLTSVNISLDSLSPLVFKSITSVNSFSKVMDGVFTALSYFKKVKLNCVVLKGINDDILTYIEAVRDIPVTLRFIELMKTASARSLYFTHCLPLTPFKEVLIENGWKEIEPGATSGPAKEFAHPAFKCKIGFITPYSENFCKTCNKLRVDSKGYLHLCLFNSTPYPLRDLLQSKDQQPALEKKIISFVRDKHFSELLLNSAKTPVKSLSIVGG